MRHIKDPAFAPLFDALPADVQALARKSFAFLKKRLQASVTAIQANRDDLWSVHVGRKYRALAIEGTDRFQWFWIGTHAEYNRLVR